MATWLAYLKSKLLLPDQEDDDFKALEVAEKLKIQLKKLELIRILSDQMIQKKKIRYSYFYERYERWHQINKYTCLRRIIVRFIKKLCRHSNAKNFSKH